MSIIDCLPHTMFRSLLHINKPTVNNYVFNFTLKYVVGVLAVLVVTARIVMYSLRVFLSTLERIYESRKLN